MPDGGCALSSLHRTCRPGKRSATGHGSPVRLRAYPIRAILLAILVLGRKSSRTTCTLRFLRAVRVQTGCANNAWWDRLLFNQF
ncbi:hypothetical protein EM820_01790 [Salmonella enterica subsp. enterica serovar Ajiobo]|nr:hypothetical protein [Salmonella enterica subsp. enterica serovar Ajiobo]ECA6077683.1 hypothetical protein [Salmonella enterica subsp. enterica serovar Ajiobo]ECA9848210.1 hypothetical protein [Salmonella enterica subsp. enterica serovar Essen]ECB1177857.1 hypothetical protein [Salmonella enterica subsp. enterica serovar Essen]